MHFKIEYLSVVCMNLDTEILDLKLRDFKQIIFYIKCFYFMRLYYNLQANVLTLYM